MRTILYLAAAFLVPTPLTAQVSDAIAAARAGGVTLACRHGITNQSDNENEMTLRYDDPRTQRRLNPDGVRQAQAMREAFRKLGVTAAEVIASPMQRARHWAELIFDEATIDSLWHTRGDNYRDARRERRKAVLASPVTRGNRFIASHVGTLNSVISHRGSMQEGDCAVLRPRGSDFEVIALVPWQAWIAAAR